jgi:hypothetical protein
MSEIVLRDIDPVLAERIRRVAESRRMGLPQALLYLLEQGLFVAETDMSVRFSDRDSDALLEAIAALEQVPNDPGFSMIGRVEPTTKSAEPAPDFGFDTFNFPGEKA